MSSAASPPCGVSVEVRGLHKSFNGVPVLRNIEFRVEPREIFVIMGPSGSGKSVLLKHIIGLDEPDQGQILIDGQPVDAGPVSERCRVAMVFQSGALLNSLTVAENVGLYLSEHRLKSKAAIARIVREKLAVVGLDGIEDRLPGDLSGGMKKRVAIARALAIEPQLILYDEPTSELDPLMAVTIAEEILDLKRRIQTTSIVVSHDRDLAFGVADRLAVMLDGRLRVVGPVDEVRASRDPEVQALLTAEFRKEPSLYAKHP